MNYKLYYSGQPGKLSASLTHDGTTFATENGLADTKAVVKWAQRAARDHKVENTPEATHVESVSVSGSKTFSL